MKKSLNLLTVVELSGFIARGGGDQIKLGELHICANMYDCTYTVWKVWADFAVQYVTDDAFAKLYVT